MNVAVDFKNVDIVFGPDTRDALAMVDEGATRDEILEKTGNVLGCAGASLTVNEGEISVLMGLSGSGKSTLLRAVNRLNIVSRGQVLVREGDKMVDVVSCDEATLQAAAPEERRHGVPAVRPAAVAHGRGECRPRPRARRHAGGRAQGARRPPAEAGQSRPVGEEIRARTVGRHAAARRPGPRLRHRSADPA